VQPLRWQIPDSQNEIVAEQATGSEQMVGESCCIGILFANMATVSEAPYILDGLLMNEVGRHVREQYADTAGFTDHLFGASSL
ncbi:Tn3 family transposase, partial [Klebsiella pneumoniae]